MILWNARSSGKRVFAPRQENLGQLRQVPFCLFTDPELARIGLSEWEAKAQGIVYRLFKIPMEAVVHASTLSETEEF